ncbi:MAG: ABC transporter substrate-binding protein [Oscillospiraceae bacterium]|jgi:iron complex transport system substrate-binding protein
MKRVFAWFMIVAMLAACLCGCGNSGTEKDAEKENKIEDTESAITVTDLDGKTYTFDEPLDKVIVQWSGAGGPFIPMSAFFGKDVYKHIAAMDNTLQDNRADMWENYLKTVPELADLPVVGGLDSDECNVELALSCGADAVITPIGMKASIQDSIQPKLEEAGIPVIYVDYHSETIENHTKSTELLGQLFGKEEIAQQMIDTYVSHVTNVYDRVEELLKTNERPTVYTEVGMGGPDEYGNSATNSYMWGAIAYNCGGTSIGDGVLQNTGALEAEYIISTNPDKIIFSGSYWPANETSIRMGFQADEDTTRELVAAYLERPGWSELDAVKNGEVYVLHHGAAREIFDYCSVEAMAKSIWPEEFADLDPEASLREFFETFLPYEFSGLWYLEY